MAQTSAAGATSPAHHLPECDPSRVWIPELVQRIAAFMHPNVVACTLRLVDRATAALLRGPQHTTVRLAQPVPEHAFACHWADPHRATRSLTREQREQLLRLTARSGSIPNLHILVSAMQPGQPLSTGAFIAAASAGHVHVCHWLAQRGCEECHAALLAAARAGHGEMCMWLLDNGCYWWRHIEDVLCAAAESGLWCVLAWILDPARSGGWLRRLPYDAAARGAQHELLAWLLSLVPGRPFDSDDMVYLLMGLARGCELPRLQHMYHTGRRFAVDWGAVDAWSAAIMRAAIESRTHDWREKVEWLLEARGYPPEGPIYNCVPEPLERLPWLRTRGFVVEPQLFHAHVLAKDFVAARCLLEVGHQPNESELAHALSDALSADNLPAVQFLYSIGVRAETYHMSTTAMQGYVQLVAWMVDEAISAGGAEILTVDLFRAAAQSGSVELAAWLRDRGCPMDASVCAEAARRGRLDLLAWLREAGCPWDEATFAAAAWAGSEAQLERLAERGCPMGTRGLAYAAAALSGDLSTLAFLRRLGCPWSGTGETFTLAAFPPGYARELVYCPPDEYEVGLRWLLEAGCTVDWTAVLRATKKWRSRRLAAWLRSAWRPLRRQQRELRLLRRQVAALSVAVAEERPLEHGWRPEATAQAEATAEAEAARHASVEGPNAPPGVSDGSSRAHLVWVPELVVRIAGFAHPNEVACTLRLVDRATAALLRGPQHTTVRLAQPVPEHAFARQWLHQPHGPPSFTRQQRRNLLCFTACTGSIPNLRVLLLRSSWPHDRRRACEVAFNAAASAGHLHVCRWMRANGLNGSHHALRAAMRAKHVDVCLWLLENGYYRRTEARRLLMVATDEGLLPVCEWMVSKGRFRPSPACVEHLAHEGKVDMVECLLSAGHHPLRTYEYVLPGIARTCDLPTLQRFYEKYGSRLDAGCKGGIMSQALGSPTPDWRAKVEWLESLGFPRRAHYGYGFPNVMRQLLWARDRGWDVETQVLDCAIDWGYWSVLQSLVAIGVSVDPQKLSNAVSSVVVRGDLPSLQVLCAMGVHVNEYFIGLAAYKGHLQMVAWIAEALPWSPFRGMGNRTLTEAVEARQKEVAVWLMEQGCTGDARIAAAVAQTQDREWLARMHELGCPWDARALAAFAREGDKEAVVWLRDRGCPMDASVCADAARSGRLDLLAWLREAGCPWDEATFAAAAWAGSEAQLEWLAQRGCPMGTDGLPYAEAAFAGDLTTLACLHRLGCPWSDATFRLAVSPPGYAEHYGAGGSAHAAGLQWLLGAGCPVDWGAAVRAARPLPSHRVRSWLRAEMRRRRRGQQQEGGSRH